MLSLKPVVLLSFVSSVILLSACQPKPDAENTNAASSASAASEAQSVTALVGTIEHLKLNLPDCKGKSCPEFSVERLNSNYAFVDAAIDQAILGQLNDMLDLGQVKIKPQIQQQSTVTAQNAASEASSVGVMPSALQQLQSKVQPYLDGFLGIDQEMKSLGTAHQISLMIKPAILQSKYPLVTVVLNSSSYLGGAHGAASQHYYNFDLSKQQPLALNDIIIANQENDLKTKAHNVFAKWVIDNELANSLADYEQAWPFSLSNNFYLAPQGLILQYGEYEIGPYVVGLPRLVIPYSELKGILKTPYFPVSSTVASQPFAPQS